MEFLASMLNFLLDIGIVIICLIFVGAYCNIGKWLADMLKIKDGPIAWMILWPIFFSVIVLVVMFIYVYRTARTLFMSFIPDSKYRISDIFDGTIQL